MFTIIIRLVKHSHNNRRRKQCLRNGQAEHGQNRNTDSVFEKRCLKCNFSEHITHGGIDEFCVTLMHGERKQTTSLVTVDGTARHGTSTFLGLLEVDPTCSHFFASFYICLITFTALASTLVYIISVSEWHHIR